MSSTESIEQLVKALGEQDVSARLVLIAKLSRQDHRLYAVLLKHAPKTFGLQEWIAALSRLFSVPGSEILSPTASSLILESGGDEVSIYDRLHREGARLRAVFDRKLDEPKIFNKTMLHYEFRNEAHFSDVATLLEKAERILTCIDTRLPGASFDSVESAQSSLGAYEEIYQDAGGEVAYWYARAIVARQDASWRAAYFVKAQKNYLSDDRLIEESDLARILGMIFDESESCINIIANLSAAKLIDASITTECIDRFRANLRKTPLIIPIRKDGKFGARIANLKKLSSVVFNSKLKELERAVVAALPTQVNGVYRAWHPAPSDAVIENALHAAEIIKAMKLASDVTGTTASSQSVLTGLKNSVDKSSEFFIRSLESWDGVTRKRCGIFIAALTQIIEGENIAQVFRRRWALAERNMSA